MLSKVLKTVAVILISLTFVTAGGWDEEKGLDQITIDGELICIGCTLKGLDGANAQCNLYAQHALGFRSGDGTIWNIVDNAAGHDVIRAHTLLGHKDATIKGYIYPIANQIEIVSIDVEGVTAQEIAQAGWDEDQILADRLKERAVGEAPSTEHTH